MLALQWPNLLPHGQSVSENGIHADKELPRAAERETRFWCHHLSPTITLDFSVKLTNKFLIGLSQVRLLFCPLLLERF